MTRIEENYHYDNYNSAVSKDSVISASYVDESLAHDSVLDFNSSLEFANFLGTLRDVTVSNLSQAGILMKRKDDCYKAIKGELLHQTVERKKREEEVHS